MIHFSIVIALHWRDKWMGFYATRCKTASKLVNHRGVKLAFVAFGAICLWRMVPWVGVLRAWLHVGWLTALIALGAVVLSAALEVLSWGVWLPSSGLRRWVHLGHSYASGVFLNQFIPTGTASDVWRWASLSKRHDKKQVLTSLAMARALMFVGLLAWMAVAIALLPNSLRQPTFFSSGIALVVLGLGGMVAIAGCAVFSWHLRVRTAIAGLVSRALDGKVLARRERWIFSLLFAVASWGALIFGITVFAHGTGLNLPWPVAALGLMVSLAFSWIPWTPNGIGWRDGAFAIVMLHAGLHLGAAVALSVFVDFSALPLALVGGALFLYSKRTRLTPANHIV